MLIGKDQLLSFNMKHGGTERVASEHLIFTFFKTPMQNTAATSYVTQSSERRDTTGDCGNKEKSTRADSILGCYKIQLIRGIYCHIGC